MNTVSEQHPIYGSVITSTNPSQLSASAVSWAAILAGAAAAAALSLILLLLGTGLGLSSLSPWVNQGVSGTTFGISSILWVTGTQLLAAGMGGYLAGRLRTRWVEVHSDEVYFRDTAHGFLAWAIASLASATLLTSVIGNIVNGGVQASAAVAAGVTSSVMLATASGAAASSATAPGDTDSEAMGYFLDTLFRRDSANPSSERFGLLVQQDTAIPMAEVTRIFLNAMHTAGLPAEDLSYVGQVVAQRTGLTQAEAELRVSETFNRAQAALAQAQTSARETVDSARKTSAYGALWLFISLLIGAFVASFAAPYGGRQRDA